MKKNRITVNAVFCRVAALSLTSITIIKIALQKDVQAKLTPLSFYHGIVWLLKEVEKQINLPSYEHLSFIRNRKIMVSINIFLTNPEWVRKIMHLIFTNLFIYELIR